MKEKFKRSGQDTLENVLSADNPVGEPESNRQKDFEEAILNNDLSVVSQCLKEGLKTDNRVVFVKTIMIRDSHELLEIFEKNGVDISRDAELFLNSASGMSNLRPMTTIFLLNNFDFSQEILKKNMYHNINCAIKKENIMPEVLEVLTAFARKMSTSYIEAAWQRLNEVYPEKTDSPIAKIIQNFYLQSQLTLDKQKVRRIKI